MSRKFIIAILVAVLFGVVGWGIQTAINTFGPDIPDKSLPAIIFQYGWDWCAQHKRIIAIAWILVAIPLALFSQITRKGRNLPDWWWR